MTASSKEVPPSGKEVPLSERRQRWKGLGVAFFVVGSLDAHTHAPSSLLSQGMTPLRGKDLMAEKIISADEEDSVTEAATYRAMLALAW